MILFGLNYYIVFLSVGIYMRSLVDNIIFKHFALRSYNSAEVYTQC